MRSMWLSAYLVYAFAASVCSAQQVHCSVQKAVVQTEADAAFLGGDFAHAEALFTSQLSASLTITNVSGLGSLTQTGEATANGNVSRSSSHLP